jgi:hypothetical protein
MKTDAELSAYQEKIEKTENVILCVAEAEKMVALLGRSLFPGLEKKPLVKRPRKPNMQPRRGRNYFSR